MGGSSMLIAYTESNQPPDGTVTVSVGAAQLVPDEDVVAWLARSDRALYQAKRSGRNTVVAGERG